jgi:hypothetical protein
METKKLSSIMRSSDSSRPSRSSSSSNSSGSSRSSDSSGTSGTSSTSDSSKSSETRTGRSEETRKPRETSESRDKDRTREDEASSSLKVYKVSNSGVEIANSNDQMKCLSDLSRGVTGDNENSSNQEVAGRGEVSQNNEIAEANGSDNTARSAFEGIEEMQSGETADTEQSLEDNDDVREDDGQDEGVSFDEQLSQNSEAAQRYEEYSDEEKEQLNSVSESLSSNESRENLVNLVGNGKLENKDGDGNTTLSNLSDMSQQEFAGDLDRTAIMEQTIQHISDPESLEQGSRGSCQTAAIQFIQASEHPSDYVKTVGGLTGKEGQVDLGYGGGSIETNQSAIQPDDSGRDDVTRVYQASVMDQAYEDKDYDNKNDTFIDSDTGEEYDRRISDHNYEDVIDPILPYNTGLVEDTDNWEEDMQNSFDQGQSVNTALQWREDPETGETPGHIVTAIGMDDENVIVRNPWGDGETGAEQGDDRGSTMNREVVNDDGGGSGGVVAIPKDEFEEYMKYYAIDEEIAS